MKEMLPNIPVGYVECRATGWCSYVRRMWTGSGWKVLSHGHAEPPDLVAYFYAAEGARR